MSNDVAIALAGIVSAFLVISFTGLGWLHRRTAQDVRASREELETIGTDRG